MNSKGNFSSKIESLDMNDNDENVFFEGYVNYYYNYILSEKNN